MKTIYVASKVKHALMWKGLRYSGQLINSTWIDEARDKESPSLPDLWLRCVREASTADALLLYVEEGEVLKGALVEVGAALSHGVRVYAVGRPDGSWIHHELVTLCEDLSDALDLINRIQKPVPPKTSVKI